MYVTRLTPTKPINNIIQKSCSKCGEHKPLTDEYFNHKKGTHDGFRSECKICRNEWRRENSWKDREYKRNWKKLNPEKVKLYENISKVNAKKKYLKSVGRTEEEDNSYRSKKITMGIIRRNTVKPNTTDVLRVLLYTFNLKKCQKCGCEKIINTNNFPKRPDSYDGFNMVCSKCLSTRRQKTSRMGIKYNSIAFKELSKYDQTKQEGALGLVKCAYCGKWINPSYSSVKGRLYSICNLNLGECRIYCDGDQCREACPTYKQKFYPKGFKQGTSREVDPLIRHMCMERDDYSCQRCEASGEGVILHAHHILSYKRNVMVANDIDNVITLCKDCHKSVHQKDGCKYHQLRCDA